MYFKQIWIAVKILRSNYKIRFSLYLAISSENGLFGFKKVRSSLYSIRSEIFFIEIGQNGYQKIRIFTLISKM
jgi:hypothetical protein